MSNNMGQSPTEADIERIAGEYGTISGTAFEDKVLTTTKGNYEIKLSDIWTVGNTTPTDPPSTTLQPGETATADKNEYYDAEADKTAIIPEGFKVSDKPRETTINGGLVVYAPDNSEYVWIPVDGIIGEEGKTVQNAVNGEIILGRYVFKEDGTIDTSLTPTAIGGTLTDEFGNIYTEDTQASHNSSYGNKIATDIEEFIQSVRDKHGYYIARYEAGIENGELDTSDMIDEYTAPNTEWTGYKGENIRLVSKAGEQAWNYVTQRKASSLCQNLYSNVNSDLVNSYAWDTAILFIQKYGTESNSSVYSIQVGLSATEQLANTGEGILSDTNKEDKQCNIYDMAGNCTEWTTETFSDSIGPCVGRGGNYDNSDYYTSGRYSNLTTSAVDGISIRPLLYL